MDEEGVLLGGNPRGLTLICFISQFSLAPPVFFHALGLSWFAQRDPSLPCGFKILILQEMLPQSHDTPHLPGAAQPQTRRCRPFCLRTAPPEGRAGLGGACAGTLEVTWWFRVVG